MRTNGGPLDNAGRNLAQLRHSPASWTLFGLVMAIHGLVAMAGEVFVDGLYGNLGLSREGFLSGKAWQLFSYGLLHGGWWHAGLNALFVLLIGSRIEHATGPGMLVKTVVAGVLGGGALHLLLGSGLLVGLSGGCLAILLLLVTLSPQSRMMPLQVSGRNLGIGILLAELILALIDPALGIPWMSGLGDKLVQNGLGAWFQMGHACHVGGGLAGWLCGCWILRPRVTLERLRRDRARREAE
jgi:membrane associated rhomboid family serine protease